MRVPGPWLLCPTHCLWRTKRASAAATQTSVCSSAALKGRLRPRLGPRCGPVVAGRGQLRPRVGPRQQGGPFVASSLEPCALLPPGGVASCLAIVSFAAPRAPRRGVCQSVPPDVLRVLPPDVYRNVYFTTSEAGGGVARSATACPAACGELVGGGCLVCVRGREGGALERAKWFACPWLALSSCRAEWRPAATAHGWHAGRSRRRRRRLRSQ